MTTIGPDPLPTWVDQKWLTFISMYSGGKWVCLGGKWHLRASMYQTMCQAYYVRSNPVGTDANADPGHTCSDCVASYVELKLIGYLE